MKQSMENEKNPSQIQSNEPNTPCKINFELNYDTFKASVNGKIIDYQKQSLLKNGLLIKNLENVPGLPEELNNNLFISLSDQLKKFDRQYIMNKYCSQISSSIERSTNTAYNILTKAKMNPEGPHSTISVTFQSCLVYLHKIPKKLKYFVLVFKKLPLHKIEILMEDNEFFSELYTILQEVYRKKTKKKGVDSLIESKVSSSESKSMDEESKIDNKDEKRTRNLQKGAQENKSMKNQESKQIPESPPFFEVMQTEGSFFTQMMGLKKFYERVNLLIIFLPYDPNFTNYLYDLNRRILLNLVPSTMMSLLEEERVTKDKKQFWKKKRQNLIVERLQKVICSIKTALRSLISSKVSYPIIKDSILIYELNEWIEENLSSISSTIKMRRVFIRFCSLCCEIHPDFINTLHSKNRAIVNMMIEEEIARSFRVIKRKEEGKEEEMERANEDLDEIINIGSKVGLQCPFLAQSIAFKIFESVLEYGGQFVRSFDLAILGSIMQVNVDFRQFIMPLMMDYLKHFLGKSSNGIRKCKIRLLEISKCVEIMLKYPTEAKIGLSHLMIQQIEQEFQGGALVKSDILLSCYRRVMAIHKQAEKKLEIQSKKGLVGQKPV